MTSLPIVFVADLNIWNGPAGHAQWHEGYLRFICPCGCGAFVNLPVNPPTADGWSWNGNKEKPSLTPSILNVRCQWHGYLTDGVFVSV